MGSEDLQMEQLTAGFDHVNTHGSIRMKAASRKICQGPLVT